jgi:hypothetical protein
VIGTGASAVQFIPEIAPVVGELVVFQRTPAWFGPARLSRPRLGGLKWLYTHVLRTASGTASGSSGGWATGSSTACGSTRLGSGRRLGQRIQRDGPHADGQVPRGRVRGATRSPRKGDAEVSAGRQAHAPRQRRVGERCAATTSSSSPTASRRSPRRASAQGTGRRRRRGTSSTSSSTAPGSRRRSSSPRSPSPVTAASTSTSNGAATPEATSA